LDYKSTLSDHLKLQVQTIKPEQWKHDFTLKEETWKENSDECCSINKVEPLDSIKGNYQIWTSGLMSSQNVFREKLNIFEEKGGIIKFYPLLDCNDEQALSYIKENNLPEHPLLRSGFSSVGCFQCTVAGRGRTGRWINKSKTECGLHL
jgi:phosphoadenosine phosphosulfate reductase